MTVTRTHAYDSRGRPSTTTTGPSALAVGYDYNARGYLSKFKQGTSGLATVTAMDAWGNATGESYGNGVSTTRTFDELGRSTGIATAKGTAKLQEEAYGWRSDGLLANRAVGSGASTDTEVFGYDHLGRLDSAKTYVDEATVRTSSTVDRSLSYGYDRLGNLTSKPGASIRYQGTGNAGPNAATSANLGVATTISYDTSGHVVRYDAATGDDTFVEWDGRGRVSRITVGTSRTTTTPTARDEFRYGPDGERYYRRTTWTETVTGDDGTPTTRTRWAETYRVGGYEKVVGDGLGGYAWVDKTRAGAAQLVRAAATATATPSSALEYLHGDHLGSLAAATDATGASLQSLAYEPYGARRRADWTGGLPQGDVAALAAAQDAGRARTGFTGHEPLDRTGFVHMGGRVYDPRLGRFLSPDPIVSEAWSGQGWNLYSYVGNSPLSRTDPTGHCYAAGPLCQVAQGGGFTNVTQALTSWNMSWRIPIFATVTWGRVSFGVGGSLWSGERGGFFGRGGFFRPRVTLRIGLPFPVFTSAVRMVSLGREASSADAPMGVGELAGALADPRVVAAADVTASIFIPGYDLYRCNKEGSCSWTDWTLGVVEVAASATGVGYGVRVLAKGGLKGTKNALKVYGPPSPGDKVYRVWGGHARPSGRSWTRVDPRSVPDFRDAAGLPRENTGRFVTEGRLVDVDGVTYKPADSLQGQRGGIDEVVIPDAELQVRIERVSGVNPEY